MKTGSFRIFTQVSNFLSLQVGQCVRRNKLFVFTGHVYIGSEGDMKGKKFPGPKPLVSL